MRTVEVTEATQSLAEYARETQTGPIVIMQNGRPIAVVMPLENTDIETVSLGENPQFLALIERSCERQQREGGISSNEMRRRLNANKK
jgi:prevent-host-death family protein